MLVVEVTDAMFVKFVKKVLIVVEGSNGMQVDNQILVSIKFHRLHITLNFVLRKIASDVKLPINCRIL